MNKHIISYMIILSLFAMSLGGCGRSKAAADQNVDPTPAQEAPADAPKSEADATTESSGSTSNSMKIFLDSGDAVDTTKHEYTVNYTDSKTGKICVVDFSSDDHSYEMCVSGLTEEFTPDQINALIGAFLSGNIATIESDDLIDAEKFSEYIYGTLGDWVFSDDYRSVDDWGDHYMCWAGSSADMLWSTGWAQLALEKNPDLTFKNVDELFSYFGKHYDNLSQMTQYDAIEWFMAGGYEARSADKAPANLPDYNPDDYSEFVSLADGDSIDKGIELIKSIKDGKAVGLSVQLNRTEYPINGDEDSTAIYDSSKGDYYKEVFIELDGDEKTESGFYVYDDLGNAVKVEKKDEDTYITEDGKEYDVFNVLKGDIYPVEDGYYAPVDADDGSIDYFTVCDDDEVDLENGTTSFYIGMGSHAITVSGYIIDVDEQQPVNSVKALFITDPDNDAHDHNMPKEVRGNELASKAGRPNTMQLFAVSPVTLENDFDEDDDDNAQTLNLENYMQEAVTLIASVTGLNPAP